MGDFTNNNLREAEKDYISRWNSNAKQHFDDGDYEWICDFIKKKYEIYKTWSLYKSIILGLSNKEKIFLKEKYSKNETTLMIDWQNPIHKHLQTLGIISMNAGTSVGNPNAIPGFLQPWVFEVIKKNPKIIDN